MANILWLINGQAISLELSEDTVKRLRFVSEKYGKPIQNILTWALTQYGDKEPDKSIVKYIEQDLVNAAQAQR